jgi:hypothetical protein
VAVDVELKEHKGRDSFDNLPLKGTCVCVCVCVCAITELSLTPVMKMHVYI